MFHGSGRRLGDGGHTYYTLIKLIPHTLGAVDTRYYYEQTAPVFEALSVSSTPMEYISIHFACYVCSSIT